MAVLTVFASTFRHRCRKKSPHRERLKVGENNCRIAPRWRSLMWSAQAQAEGLTLLVAENKAGYFGVHLAKLGQPKPYRAELRRGGKKVHLGSFATAEEAALCFARSPEGQVYYKEAMDRAAAPPPAPPPTSKEVLQQAHAEKLVLRVAENKTGYFGVSLNTSSKIKPYEARVKCSGKLVSLGSFAIAEEAALCVARSPEGQAAAERAAASAVAPPPAPPLTSEEARQQAQVEGLALLVAKTKTGYRGVNLNKPGKPRPYQAQVKRGGKQVTLGRFATAEEAALCVARTPEGRAVAAVEKVAATPPLVSEEAQQQARDAIIGAVALDIIYEAAGAAAEELSAEVAAEVMAGIAMGL